MDIVKGHSVKLAFYILVTYILVTLGLWLAAIDTDRKTHYFGYGALLVGRLKRLIALMQIVGSRNFTEAN